jgi:putative ATPase
MWWATGCERRCSRHPSFNPERRLLRIASEDVGNADLRAFRIVLDAWETYERLGSPEGELAIAQALVYLACAPKSNAVYLAYQGACQDVRASGSLPVPPHLRNIRRNPVILFLEIA